MEKNMKRAGITIWKKWMSVMLSIVLIVGMITGNNYDIVKAAALTMTVKLQINVKGFSGEDVSVIGEITLRDGNNPSNIYECTSVSVNQDMITYEVENVSMNVDSQVEDEKQFRSYQWLLDGEVLMEIDGEGQKEQEQTDTITFCSVWFQDGEQILNTQYVQQNSKVAEPDSSLLAKEGFEFNGWVSEEEGDTKFDFESEITEATHIYSSWVEDTAKEQPEKSGQSEESKEFEEPKEPEASVMPKQSKIPKTPKVSNQPEIEKTPEVPKQSEIEKTTKEKGNVVFSYENYSADTVYVSGSFNEFAKNDPAWQMEKNVNEIWELSKEIESGVYEYVFIVDGEEQVDPANNTYYPNTEQKRSKLVVPGAVKSPIVNGDSVTFYYPVSMLPEDVTKVSVLIYDYSGGSVGEMSLSPDGTHYTCTIAELDKGEYSYEIAVERESSVFNEYYQDFYNMKANPITGYSIFIITQEHIHSFDDQWTFDVTGHWHECRCGEREEEVMEHEMDEGTITTEPTESSTGVRTYRCKQCAYVMKSETIPQLEHIHDYNVGKWQSDANNHWHECRCGDKEDIAAHVSDKGTVTTKPTQTKTGVMTYRCNICKVVLKTVTIAATGTTNNDGNMKPDSSGDKNNNGNLNSDERESKQDSDKDLEKDSDKDSDGKDSKKKDKNKDDSKSEEESKANTNNNTNNNGNNHNTNNAEKDNEPNTGERSFIEIYASIAMIAGLSYIRLYFENGKKGMTEKEKKEMIAMLVGWAKKGKWLRKYAAMIAIFFLLAYYHSIGKNVDVEWKEVYGE